MLPTLALGAGWGVATAAASMRQRALAHGIGVVSLLILLWHVAGDLRFDGKKWSHLKYDRYGGIDFVEVERCGRAVNQMLEPDETFYALGLDPGVYYYSDRRYASGIFWANRMFFGTLQTHATQKVIEDLNRTRPPLVLIQRGWDSRLDHPVLQYVLANYILSPEAGFSQRFTVYIRQNSALAARVLHRQEPFVLTLSDVNPTFLNEFAMDLFQKGRVDETIACYQKVLKIEPNAPQVHNNLGQALAQQGKWNEAIPHFELAIQLKPDLAQPHTSLGIALAQQGKLTEAMEHFQQGLNLAMAQANPELAEAIRTQMKLYLPPPSQSGPP